MSLEMKYQGDGGFCPEGAWQTLLSRLLLSPRGAERPGSPLLTLTPIALLCVLVVHMDDTGGCLWDSFQNHHSNHPFPVPWGIFKSDLLFILFFFFNNSVGFSKFTKYIHKVVKSSLQSIVEHVITLERNSIPFSHYLPTSSPFPQALATMNLLSVFIDLPILDIAYK